MLNQSLASNEGLIREDIRHSQPSVSHLGKQIRYSRHLFFQSKRISLNGRSRVVIHTSIQAPTTKLRPKENQTINSDHDLHSVRHFI